MDNSPDAKFKRLKNDYDLLGKNYDIICSNYEYAQKRVKDLEELLVEIKSLGFLTVGYDSGVSHKEVCLKAKTLGF